MARRRLAGRRRRTGARYVPLGADVATTRIDADGARYEFAHDTELRVVGVTNPQGLRRSAGRSVGRSVHRSYAHRADGLPECGVPSAGTREFDLDRLGQVTAVRGTGGEEGWTEHYAYYRARSTTHASWPTSESDRELLGDRVFTGTLVRRAGGVTYAHDAEGRVVRRTRRRLSHRPDTWHYQWEALDHLIAVITPDGTRSSTSRGHRPPPGARPGESVHTGNAGGAGLVPRARLHLSPPRRDATTTSSRL